MRSTGIALLVACAALGCRTGDRLWRLSPFEGTSGGERMNLWPLAYHDTAGTSVLWPVFDVDQRGFALRPLVAKDDSAYSILFPLSSFDTDAGEGWIGPFYRFGGHAGLFPLSHLGQTSYVGPVWWTETSSGLFPVIRFGSLSYVGPVWWSDTEGMKGGVFPVAGFGPTSFIGPAWWTSDGESYGLFPLFAVDLLGWGVDQIGPFWWRRGGEQGFSGGIAPVFWYGDHGGSLGILPFYWHDVDEHAQSRSYLLGLAHTSSGGGFERDWVAPLYYHATEPGRSDTVLFPFFWKRTRGEESDVFTLLGNRAVEPHGSSFNLYPLWWSSAGAESSWQMLFPLFYYGREGDARTLLTPLGGRGWSPSGDDDFVNVLGPLFHHSASASRGEERTAFLWPLFERHRRGDEVTLRMAGLYDRSTTPAGTESTVLFGLGHAESSAGGGSAHRLWPLYSWCADREAPGPLYGLTLYGWHRSGETTEQHLFPLYSSVSSPASAQLDGLLGLVHHEREGAETARSERWWVWPLVSRSRGPRGPGISDATALLGMSSWEGGRHFQLGASLLYSRSSEENAAKRSADSRALLLFTHEEEEFVGSHVPVHEAAREQNRVARESRGFLFDAFVSERETYHRWDAGAVSDDEARALRSYTLAGSREDPPDRDRARAALANHGVEAPGDDAASLQRAIADFTAAHTHTAERRHVRLPLLFDYERDSDPERGELSWSGPLGLVSYDRDPRKTRTSFLYYGYRSTSAEGRTRRDIFPFITWDTGPEEKHLSFLWRLLDYERKGERRGGHVLFIPWGDV